MPENGNLRKDNFFVCGSQSEDTGHHGWEGMEANVTGADMTGIWAISYAAFTVRKQR